MIHAEKTSFCNGSDGYFSYGMQLQQLIDVILG